MSKFDAVFVGLTILDIAGRPVQAIPQGGNVTFIEQIRLNPAGTAAGANINAAKLGIRTAAVACLGDDEKGDLIQSSYRRLGIDLSLLQFSPQRETSATILPIRPNGERPALHYRGASDDLFVSKAQFDAVLDCRYLHHGGSGLLAAMDGGQSALLLAAAKARGIVTSFDLIAPGPDTLALLRPLLPYVDWFMPSLEEAAAISGLSDPEAIAAFFFDLGAGNCIFKDGERGSWLFQSGQPGQRIPAWQVVVQDTTGCGDGYCGGFIAALVRGLEPAAACRVASAVAALVATGLGSDAGVVDWDHTEAFMAETPLLG